MIYEMLRKEVTYKLKEDKIREGIAEIDDFISKNELSRTNFSKSFITISRRYNEIERKDIQGLVNLESYSIFKNKIVVDILNFLANESIRNEEKMKPPTEMNSMDIWLELKEDFEEFRKDENKVNAFLDRIQKLLQVDRKVKIRQMKPGSVWVLLNLPIKSAFQLYKKAKEGKLIDLNVTDAHFWLEKKKEKKFDLTTIQYDNQISYEELGFQLGLLDDESFKDNFIKKYRFLYEENIKKEDEQRVKIESNLYNQLESLEGKVHQQNINLNKLKKSISLLEFMLYDTQQEVKLNIESKENNYLTNLIEQRQSEIKEFSNTIKGLQTRIEIINEKLNEKTNFIDKDIANLAKEDWKNKVLKVIENIEKGFAHGYTKRKMSTAANQA